MRILLVDDQASFRAAVKAWLATETDLHIVGEAADGDSGVDAVRQLNPDLVLMDINLPTVDGIEAAHRIRLMAPLVRVLFLSQLRAEEYLFMAIKTGARGFVSKDVAPQELVPAIRAVQGGQCHFSPCLVELMRRHLSA